MEPLSIALIGASVLLAMGLASFAGLKGWHAWLDYKRLELASQTGDHASRRPAAGSSWPISRNGSASWKRSPPASTSSA